MNLYVIRHGETEWNKKKILQGWLNSNLTKEGKEAADNLRKKFKEDNIKIDQIYTSTQKRAIDTAEIINKDFNLEITKLDELKELGFGKWENMCIDDIYKEYEEDYNIYINSPKDYTPTCGGESYEELYERVERALDIILSSNKENILVVTHGVTLKVIVSLLENIPLEKINEIPIYKGTAVNKFIINNDEIIYEIKGDTSHLGGDI